MESIEYCIPSTNWLFVAVEMLGAIVTIAADDEQGVHGSFSMSEFDGLLFGRFCLD